MKIICIGEALIDFTPYLEEGTYIQNFGGAPANVAVIAGKLGQDVQFIGKVGDDQFGSYIIKTLEMAGVDTKYVLVTSDACTTLAFVHLSENGERSFDFVRKPGADLLLLVEDIPEDFCEKGDIVHFGSAQLMNKQARQAIGKAIRIAKKNGAVISFDPNYRPLQWSDEREAKKEILQYLSYADIVKVSDEEAVWLTGEKNRQSAVKKLLEYTEMLVIMTCGEEGAYYWGKAFAGYVPGCPAKAVDTTGAGDAFWGTFLAMMLEKGTNVLECTEWAIREAVCIANAAGAACVTQKGSIVTDISFDQLRELIKK